LLKEDWNMRVSPFLLALLMIAAVIAGGSPASAYTYNGYNVVNAQNLRIRVDPPQTSYELGGVGQVVLHGSGADSGNNLAVWCLDVFDWLAGSGTYSSGALQPTTPNTGTIGVNLSGTQIGQIGALVAHANSLISTAYDASAAIQLAIWHVEYGSDAFSYLGGGSNLATLASEYYNNATKGTWDPVSGLQALYVTSGNQTMTFIATTPLPATWAMLLGGVLGLGLLLNSRGKKNAVGLVAAWLKHLIGFRKDRREAVFLCVQAWSTACRCKSSIQPEGGEGLAKRNGVIARRGLKEREQSCGSMDKNPLYVKEEFPPWLRALAHTVDEVDKLFLAFGGGANNDQQALRGALEARPHVNAVDPEIAFGREIAFPLAGVLVQPGVLGPSDSRGRESARVLAEQRARASSKLPV
jgi:hypothetical protein